MEEPTPQPPPCREGEKNTEPQTPSPKKERQRRRKTSFSPSLQGGGWGVGQSHQPPVAHIVTGQTVSDSKLELLQKLRHEMTPEEILLWSRLRANRLRGFHFRQQQFIHGFIADFYCHAAGVVVEVDGGVH